MDALPPGLRVAHLSSFPEPQELYVERRVESGRAHVLTQGSLIVGHAVVSGDEVVEFSCEPDAMFDSRSVLDEVLARTGASGLLCQSFDTGMMALAASRPGEPVITGYLFRTLRDSTAGAASLCSARPGVTGDTGSIWEMQDGFFDDVDEIGQYIEHDRLFVYETSPGEIAGCGILTRVAGGHDAIDLGMVVTAAQRGRGIGSQIVAHLVDHCVRRGDRPIAGCHVDNVASRRALERGGLVPSHRLLTFAY